MKFDDPSEIIGSEELSILPEDERLMLHSDFEEEVIVYGNPSLIGSIFRNLTENAIAYSEGKNIYISLLENGGTMCHIRREVPDSDSQ